MFLQVKFQRSEDWQKRKLIETGKLLSRDVVVILDIDDPSDRAEFVELFGATESRFEKISTNFRYIEWSNGEVRSDSDVVVSDDDLTLAECFEYIRAERDFYSNETAKEEAIARFAAERKLREEKKLEEQKTAEIAAQNKRNEEMKPRMDWADKFGSDQLKRGLATGHTCTRLYVLERAAKEYPDFVVDFNDTANWEERSTPSVEALDALDEVKAEHPKSNAKIVWLTARASNNTPDDDDDDYYSDDDNEFSPREAIVIREFLARDLVKEI
jgi:hypothetical protein